MRKNADMCKCISGLDLGHVLNILRGRNATSEFQIFFFVFEAVSKCKITVAIRIFIVTRETHQKSNNTSLMFLNI